MKTESELILIIAKRYAELQRDAIAAGADLTEDGPAYIAKAIAASHANVEPLRLDLLAEARSSDLAHDVAGILRGDVFQSARYALAYHPRPSAPTEADKAHPAFEGER